MPRRPRSELPDGIFHVTANGVADTAIFVDDDDRRRFLRLLADVVHRFDWTCLVFCLLGTHYHVLLDAKRRDLSAGMHRLNGLYAQHYNERYERCGHLFGDRFSAWLMLNEEHFWNTCRYVLMNPVRAGLVSRPEDWPWAAARLDEHTFDR